MDMTGIGSARAGSAPVATPAASGSVAISAQAPARPGQAVTVDQSQVSPWARLEGRGWPDQARVALAAVLDPPLQAALAQEFERMAQAGVAFEKRSTFTFGNSACSAQQAFAHAMNCPATDLDLAAQLPNGTRVRVSTLQDLMAVDLLGAGGEASRGTTADARAFLSLEKDGWTFVRAGEGAKNLSALEAFRQAGSESMSVHLLGPKSESMRLYARCDIVATNYFMGDGRDLGLTNPALAGGLKKLDDSGYAWGRISGGWYDQSALDVYRGDFGNVADNTYWMAAKSDLPGSHRNPLDTGKTVMPVSPARLGELASHPDKLEAKFQSFQEAAAKHLQGVDSIRIQCGLLGMADASMDLPWENLLGGYQRFLAVAPRNTAPIDLGEGYRSLLKDCPSTDELDYRLAYLEKDFTNASGSSFRARLAEAVNQHIADKREIEAMLKAVDEPAPADASHVAVTENEVHIGNLVLPRRAEPQTP